MIDTVASEMLEEEEIIAFKILEMNCSVNWEILQFAPIYIKKKMMRFEEQIHLILRQKNGWLTNL